MQSKYGEIGAGIGIGTAVFRRTVGYLADISRTGANAMRVLKDLGLVDEIMARSESMKSMQSSIELIRGPGEHDMIYDVRTIRLSHRFKGQHSLIGIRAIVSQST